MCDVKHMLWYHHTLTSMSSMRWAARIIGRPTTEGNVCSGKLEPAYPHLTNYGEEPKAEWIRGRWELNMVAYYHEYSLRVLLTPVPLSHTITFLPSLSISRSMCGELYRRCQRCAHSEPISIHIHIQQTYTHTHGERMRSHLVASNR